MNLEQLVRALLSSVQVSDTPRKQMRSETMADQFKDDSGRPATQAGGLAGLMI